VRLGIFTSGRRDWNVERLREEALRRGWECHEFPLQGVVARLGERPRVTCLGRDLEEFDLLLVRWVPKGSAEQLVFRMDVLHRLENLGIRVVNPPSSIERCADKFYTNSLLEDAGLPVPPTVVTERREEARRAFEGYGEVVVKPLFGSLGAGMLRVREGDLAYRLFSVLEYGRHVYYVQKFIPHGNWDLRILVIGERTLGMRRVGRDWKTNVSAGALPEPWEPDEESREMALRAAEVVGCEYAGVDLLVGEDGRKYVVEVNAIPGWKGMQSVRRENVASLLLDHLEGKG
jgi:RimK family alpha-L-glutamate ligase